MLAFFRKYQRIFFFITTFVIVVSFLFFGTQLNVGAKEIKDKRISQTISGKPVTLRQVQLFSNFLNTKWDDQANPNLFNDNVLVEDVFKSGLGVKLAAAYFDKIKADLEKSFERTKNFKPYSHPKHDFLSSENIWAQFSPKIAEKYKEFKKYKEFSLDTFKCMTKLFIDQDEFPPYLLKSILLNTQKRQSWIQPDPTLLHKNLALFNFKSSSDWFGKQFLDLVAQFILNASSISFEKGYSVSYDEAKVDLYKNFISALKKRKDFDKDQLDTYFSHQLNRLNMTEKEAVCLWSNILSFRKYFKSMTDSVILDQDIWPFKTTKAKIISFQLPNYLKFNTFKDALKLDVYLLAVAKQISTDKLALPQQFLSVAKVKKSFPELVETKYKVILKQVSQEKLKTKIAMKDIWSWQLKDDNWSKLKNKFSFINIDIATSEARFEKLKALKTDSQNLVDDYTRDEILNEQASYLLDALNNTQEKELTIGVSENRLTEELVGIDSSANLKKFLTNCNDKVFSEPYTDNKKVYYQFKVIESTNKEELMSFERSQETNAIELVLEKFLRDKYLAIRSDNSGQFKDSEGVFKPFELVIDDVGLIVFKETYNDLKDKYAKYQEKGQNPLQFFTAARLISHMEKAYTARDSDLNDFLNDSSKSEALLASQWKLIKLDKSLHSKENNDNFLISAFDLDNKKFSNLGFYENSPMFFQLINKNSETDQEAITNKKNIISNEILDSLTDKIIEQMISKNVVCFIGE